MRTFFSSLFAGGVLLLLGAGCASAPLADQGSSVQNTAQESSQSSSMKTWTFPGQLEEGRIRGKIARITTEHGDIVIRLFDETAPLTVSNFVYLADEDYFDGLTFHRREEGFVIQGGDPSGNGTGGPGYTFQDEVDDEYSYKRGIVAMANRGPNTNGSQFFIMLDDAPLPKSYSIFGEVISGMDVVDRVRVGDVMQTVQIESDAEEGV